MTCHPTAPAIMLAVQTEGRLGAESHEQLSDRM